MKHITEIAVLLVILCGGVYYLSQSVQSAAITEKVAETTETTVKEAIPQVKSPLIEAAETTPQLTLTASVVGSGSPLTPPLAETQIYQGVFPFQNLVHPNRYRFKITLIDQTETPLKNRNGDLLSDEQEVLIEEANGKIDFVLTGNDEMSQFLSEKKNFQVKVALEAIDENGE